MELEPATTETAPNVEMQSMTSISGSDVNMLQATEDMYDLVQSTEENMPKSEEETQDKDELLHVRSEMEIPIVNLTTTKVDGEGLQANKENLNTIEEFPVFDGDDSDPENNFSILCCA